MTSQGLWWIILSIPLVTFPLPKTIRENELCLWFRPIVGSIMLT